MPAFVAIAPLGTIRRYSELISNGIQGVFKRNMTRKIVSTLSIAALLSAGALAQAADTNAAPAASTTANSLVAGPTKVAIINIQAAIANTNEGQRDLDALQKKFEPKQIELKSLSDEVDNLKKQLAAQTNALNEDERNKRVQTIESKQKTLQRDLEDAQNDYQTQSNEIAQRIGTKLMQSVDITKPVIEAYNAASGVPAPAPAAKTTPSAPSAITHRPATAPATTRPAAPSSTPK